MITSQELIDNADMNKFDFVKWYNTRLKQERNPHNDLEHGINLLKGVGLRY